ncbi:hypothetical protein QVZ43_11825 [Marinobacter sp. chi1]|uniref:Sulfotransferase family protein n=1 Tax=Marinobacter suaedae TaxID=3057675 RepID=A0ABT8W2E6_9GAMM|nr:hypothetical protein [Marinobacter sp. chi1]MDO3722412.1 hypothetical protein [Marinobacter sp. chi1]
MDLMKMKVGLYHELKEDLRGKYVLDKILHNEHVVDNDIFKTVSPKIIFLLRTPESTIKSIINMGREPGMEGYKDPEAASVYYCLRLEEMKRYAALLDGNYFFLESDDLVNSTDYILSELTEWLGLKHHLVSNYIFFNNTGKAGYGDRSDKILAGKVINTEGHPCIEISPNLLQEANSSYVSCREYLRSCSNYYSS